jgi:hypothetical protein
MNFTHAVVMGDLVSSENAKSVRQLHDRFNKGVEALNATHRKDIASPLTITLGDEFQGLTRTISAALHIARTLRLNLILEDVKCRFVVGLARVETPINKKVAWNMMGPGLSTARQKLNDKHNANAVRFSLPEDPAIEPLLDAIGRSITEIQDSWTERQKELIAANETAEGSAKAVARKLRIASNTYYKIRRAARLDLHDAQWDALDSACRSLDVRYRLGAK